MKRNMLGKTLTQRNCLLALLILFAIMALIIGSLSYDPLKDDIADATTNVIWTEQYSKGIFDIPIQNWTYGMTQSVVVLKQGEYVVVNEKGPGLACMLVPFHVFGIEFLFGPLLVGLAIVSTYMLGKRFFNWRVGFIAAVIVLLNLTVIIMWFRYYWVDAATMHLLVVSIWLIVEANYWFNGKTLQTTSTVTSTSLNKLTGIGFALLSGVVFGASVTTRYPVSLIIISIFIYMLVFYLLRVWPSLKKGDLRKVFKNGSGLSLLIFFTIGLSFILVPLISYNSTYFGGPFKSGYDATSLGNFMKSDTLAPRNGSTTWIDNLGSGIVNAWNHLMSPIGVTLLIRMPAFFIAPFGFWLIRKNKPAMLLLLLWILIGLFTYLSLSVVTMYSGWDFILTKAHEPRYFMPVVPASAILGAIGIEYLIFHQNFSKKSTHKIIKRHRTLKNEEFIHSEKRTSRGILLAGVILFLIVLPGLYPAIIHFANPDLVFPPNMTQRSQQGIPSNVSRSPQQVPPTGPGHQKIPSVSGEFHHNETNIKPVS